MRIEVVAVGRLREAHYRAAADDYIHRLRRYGRFEEREVRDGGARRRGSPAEVKAAEGEALLLGLSPQVTVVAMDERGDQLTSAELARELERRALYGESHTAFLIGGADGHSPQVLERASRVVSLSRMTLPHELARVVLWEQLYRAMTILKGEPYHR